MEMGVLVGFEAPFAEVPRTFERHCFGFDAAEFGHDLAEPERVVGYDPIEIDAENELGRT